MSISFQKIANKTSEIIGAPWHFGLWVSLVIVWFLSGFVIGFTDTWNFWANSSNNNSVKYSMIYLLFWCAFWAVMSYLFKSVFPLWDWAKVTGWILSLLFSIYYGVCAFLLVVPIPALTPYFGR